MSIYQEIILDHYRNPRNQGVLKMPTHTAKGRNPTCGDKIEMQLSVKNDTIEDVRFSGTGCAISQASASILTEFLQGKSVRETASLDRKAFFELLGIELSLTREKCALLSLETFKKSLTSKL